MENIPQSLVSHLVSSPLYVTEHVSELQGIVSHGSTYNPQLSFVFQKLRSSSEFFSTHLCPQADPSIALIPFSPWTETPWAPLESCPNFPISTSGHLGSSWVHKQSRNTFACCVLRLLFSVFPAGWQSSGWGGVHQPTWDSRCPDERRHLLPPATHQGFLSSLPQA